jgi:uncharacterized protein
MKKLISLYVIMSAFSCFSRAQDIQQINIIDTTQKTVEQKIVTALHDNDLGTLKLLIRKIDINKRLQDGKTLLMLAAVIPQHNFIDFLVERGAKLDIKDDNGMTACIHAAKAGTIMLQRFVKLGADLNLQDNEGRTALIWTALNDHINLARLLLYEGVDIAKKDASGKTALDIARESNNQKLEELIHEVISDHRISRIRTTVSLATIVATTLGLVIYKFLLKKPRSAQIVKQ